MGADLGVQIGCRGRTLANSPAILTGGHVAEPFIVAPQLSPMPPVLNQPITASWTVSGGTPPYTTIGWYWVINTTDSVYFPMKLTPGQLVLETVFNFDQSMGDAQTGQFSVTMQDARPHNRRGWLPFIVVQSEHAIPPTLRGDANDSGHLDIGDLTSMLDHMLTQSPLKSPANADTNADSKIDETDLLFIIWGLLP